MIRWQTAIPSLESSWLVRYRFEAEEQLSRHLRVQNGGPGFLFLRDRALPFATGSRVVLELAFAASHQRSLLHGSVRSRERDGLWLELPGARSALSWIRTPDAPRRIARRVAADLFAEVRVAGQTAFLCRVADLSTHGARLWSGSLGTLLAGDEISLSILPPEPRLPSAEVRARVAWAAHREAGLELESTPASLRDLVGIIESRWDRADELAHPDGCTCVESGDTSEHEPWPYWIPR